MLIHESDPQQGHTESDGGSDTSTKSMAQHIEHFSGPPSGVRVAGIYQLHRLDGRLELVWIGALLGDLTDVFSSCDQGLDRLVCLFRNGLADLGDPNRKPSRSSKE